MLKGFGWRQTSWPASECMIMRPKGPGITHRAAQKCLESMCPSGQFNSTPFCGVQCCICSRKVTIVTVNDSRSLAWETSPLPAHTETVRQLVKHIRQCDSDLPRTVLKHFQSLRRMAELCLSAGKGMEGSTFIEGERDSCRST